MLTSLDRKMLRDLWQMKGQAIAIILVIGCGIATFVMSLSTLASLQQTRSTYYNRYRFAHVFAHLKRAPDTLAARLRRDPGCRPGATENRHGCHAGCPGPGGTCRGPG